MAKSGNFVLYILRLRCLGTSNTYKNSFCFFSKAEIFQKDVEYVPKKVFLSSGGLDYLVVYKKAVLRTFTDLSIWNKTRFLFKCRVMFWLRYFLNATFDTLALSSCVWDVLQYRIIKEKQLWFFWKRGLRRFGLYAVVLMIFLQTFREILGDFTEKKTPTFQNDVEYVPKLSVWALLCFFLWL